MPFPIFYELIQLPCFHQQKAHTYSQPSPQFIQQTSITVMFSTLVCCTLTFCHALFEADGNIHCLKILTSVYNKPLPFLLQQVKCIPKWWHSRVQDMSILCLKNSSWHNRSNLYSTENRLQICWITWLKIFRTSELLYDLQSERVSGILPTGNGQNSPQTESSPAESR